MLNNKKAAIELTMGTVVIVVLSVTLLILGMILIRSIMCSGLTVSESISSGVQNQVKSLFSTDTFGVHCMGEGSQDIKLGTGGRRKIVCFVKTDEETTYDIIVTDIKSLKGAPTETLNGWVLLKEVKGVNVPAGPEKEVDMLLLDIPRSASATTVRATIEATNTKTGSSETIYSTFDIVPTGFIQGSIC